MGRSRSPSHSRGRRSRSYSRSRSRSSSYDSEGYRVHVANLGLDCSRKELEHAFEKFGPLIEVWLARNPPCFAFVVYRHKEDAEEAIRDMDGSWDTPLIHLLNFNQMVSVDYNAEISVWNKAQ